MHFHSWGGNFLWATKYKRITSTDDLIPGKQYVISDGTKLVNACEASITFNLGYTTSGFSVSTDVIELNEIDPATPVEFTLGGTSEAYTLAYLDNSTTYYLGGKTTSSDNTKFTRKTSADAANFLWNIAIYGEEEIYSASTTGYNSTTRYIALNGETIGFYTAGYTKLTLYKKLEPYTVTYGDATGGSATEGSIGAGVILPNRVDEDIDRFYTFVGWCETNLSTETTVRPTTILAAGTTYYPTRDITLYPVYSRTVSASATKTASVTIAAYASANSWANGTKYSTVNVNGVISVNTVNPKNDTGQYNDGNNTWRMYQSYTSIFTVNATTGYELVSATFTYSIANTAVLLYNGTRYATGNTITLSGSESSQFSVGQQEGKSATNGQVQISGISVDYKRAALSYYTSNPTSVTPAHAMTTCVAPYDMDFSSVVGLEAYVAIAASASSVTMEKVLNAPKGTPLLLVGTAETKYDIPIAASASAPVTNYLTAGDGITEFNGSTYDYLLYSDGKFYQIGSGAVAKNKAYLHLVAAPSAHALEIVFDDSDVTGIKAIDNRPSMTDNSCYDLMGRKVAQPTRGLYIVNGRKVVIR